MTRRLLFSGALAAGLAVVGIGVVAAVTAAAQTPAAKQTFTDQSKTTRGSGGTDANIKGKQGPNDPAANPAAPPNKGGDKTRGATTCLWNFDNYTPWLVEAYVDGEFWGVIPRYGDLDTLAGNGPTVLYARALFSDGSVRTWGPRTVQCRPGGEYSWELHR